MTSSYSGPKAIPISAEESQAQYDAYNALDAVEAQTEEEKKKKQATAKQDDAKAKQKQAEAKQKQQEPTGVGGALKEVGTAIVGAGIDAVEGVGANVQQTLTGQVNNPDFTPTWLQVDDKVEPINKTWWGNIIRGVGEFGILSAATRKAGGKLPGKAGSVLGGTGIRSELARGVVVGNLSSQSQGDNLSRTLADAFPWMPDVLATNDADSPLMKRFKNTVEGLGLDYVFDAVAGGLKGLRAKGQADQAELLAKQAQLRAAGTADLSSVSTVPIKPTRPAAAASGPPEANNVTELSDGFRGMAGAASEGLYRGIWEGYSTGSGAFKDDVYVRNAKAFSDKLGRPFTQDELNRVVRAVAGTEGKKEDWISVIQSEILSKPLRDNTDVAVRVADAEIKTNQAARQANFDEMAESRLADDPDGLNGPDPYVNSPLYDKNENPVLSVRKDSLERALLDAYKIDADPRYRDGRAESLFTEAALEKRLAGESESRRKIIESVAKRLGNDDTFKGEVNGIRVTRQEYRNLAIARALDTIDEFGDPEDLEAFKAKLLSQPATQTIGGKSVNYMNAENLAAAELLLNVTAGEYSDIATAARSVRGVLDTTAQEDMVLRRMEFLLKETKKAKFIWGQTGNQMKEGGIALLNKADIDVATKQIDADVAATLGTLKQLRDQGDDTLLQHFIDAASISNGKIQTLVDLDNYMKDRIWKWNGPTSEQGGIAKGFVSTFVNSVLSGPKTVLRAWTGTSLAVALRPITLYTGGLLRGDDRLKAKALHQMAVWHEGAGESLSLFSKAWKAHLSGEGMPYSNFAGNTDALHLTDRWKALGDWVETRGTDGDKSGYRIATALSRMNNFPLVNYTMGLMGAGDAANRTILGRMELKNMAFDRAWKETNGNINAQLVRKYEDEMRNLVFDKDGMVSDFGAQMAGDEAALTTDLSGNFQRLENLFNENPLLKPFFMFPKTGINALKYAFSFNPLGISIARVPVLNSFLKEVDEIMNVRPDNLESVMTKYGIKDIEAAQAMYEGRIAFGQVVTLSAAGLYLSGGLTGNGPHDKETRNAWIQSGWKPRSIRIAGTWVGYDSIDPFASLLAMVADVGDNSDQLGQTFTETWYERISYVIAMNLTQKSFLSGIQPLADILSAGGVGAQANKTVAMFANNLIPFSSLRKEAAEAWNPGMRELEDNYLDYIANRNPGFKGNLPYKNDVLNGQPLRLYDPMTRFMNIVSPFQVNPDWNQTRDLLRRSGFDVAYTLRTDSKGVKLSAADRSKMQNEMGKEGIEKKLDTLFGTKAYLDSYELAREVRAKGIPSNQWPISSFYHTKAIEAIFREAKANAETRIQLREGNTQASLQARTASVAKEAAKAGDTETARKYAELINMVK